MYEVLGFCSGDCLEVLLEARSFQSCSSGLEEFQSTEKGAEDSVELWRVKSRARSGFVRVACAIFWQVVLKLFSVRQRIEDLVTRHRGDALKERYAIAEKNSV